jgi:hypothetical protein
LVPETQAELKNAHIYIPAVRLFLLFIALNLLLLRLASIKHSQMEREREKEKRETFNGMTERAPLCLTVMTNDPTHWVVVQYSHLWSRLAYRVIEIAKFTF